RNLAALKGITDDMSKKISSELSEGILKGEDMRRLSKRITESTNIPIERARVMARTETMYAFNIAANEEYKAYGVGKVEWVAALDERMCDICGKYHGKIYPIDEAPDAPAHPNCRCVKIPYIEEVA
ncbi:MAG TPA: phage minor head protein, partial [Methanomassiliicoccales archaeon]|nr:phage minor head protein [Methanomassiliicoccales archaeon]